jgi:hypothetical protein
MNIDRLTEMLAVIEPLEGLSHAGTVAVFDAHWKTANRYAATEVSKMFPMFLGERDLGRRTEIAYQMAVEGCRIRNEYLAKAA